MKAASLVPRVHLFVCANRREEGNPLGAGCGAAGDAVFDRLKADVAQRGAYRAIWITRTHCLGVCPKTGCAVAEYPAGQVWTEVQPAEASALFARATEKALP